MSKKKKDPYRHKPSRHHLRCRSNGGDNSDSNISIVSQNAHRAWHLLFSNMLPPTICHIINDKWLDRRWKLICVDIRHAEKVEKFLKQLT
jgi:hypothetical protein